MLIFGTLILMVKMLDPVAKVSGHDSKHMAVRTFIFHQDLTKIKVAWSAESEFQ